LLVLWQRQLDLPAQSCLFVAIVIGKRKVPWQVHAIMQDARDLNGPFCGNPIHQQVATATTMSRNMERAQPPQNLVSGPRPRNVGTIGEFTDGPNDRVSIGVGLARAEVLSGPFENIRQVELCGSAEANAPFGLGHDILILLFWK